MGQRKRNMASAIKESNKTRFFARLNDCPTSPRKMKLVADLIRGLDVTKAAGILQFTQKHAAKDLEKLLWSAIHNFEAKSGERWDQANLVVKEISVDHGRALKRVMPAPQGRAYRMKKRSNHVTIILDKLIK